MPGGPLPEFLYGATVLAAGAIGLFFIRFWRKTRDRLFLVFALTFWLLGLNWAVLAFAETDEVRSTVFVVRLIAFVLILGGIVDKNRRGRAAERAGGRAPGAGRGL